MDSSRFDSLRKGLLEHLVLAIVAKDEVYAADVLRGLNAAGFATQEGTLYPLLSKMRRQGLLDYQWRESAAGPPRKYYTLAPDGVDQLAGFRDYWKNLTILIDTIGR